MVVIDTAVSPEKLLCHFCTRHPLIRVYTSVKSLLLYFHFRCRATDHTRCVTMNYCCISSSCLEHPTSFLLPGYLQDERAAERGSWGSRLPWDPDPQDPAPDSGLCLPRKNPSQSPRGLGRRKAVQGAGASPAVLSISPRWGSVRIHRTPRSPLPTALSLLPTSIYLLLSR